MSMAFLFTALLTAILLAISYVDFREMRIPDGLSLALLVAGAVFWLAADFKALPGQLLFSATVAALFWLVRQAHYQLSGRIGLGLGDVKMAGAGAVWIAPALFPLFLFAASFSGLAFALLRPLIFPGTVQMERVPFAPFLSLGLLLAWATEVTIR